MLYLHTIEGHLHDFYVGVGNTSAVASTQTYVVCVFYEGTPVQLKIYMDCDNRSLWGRYVTIQINSDLTTERLTLCEVEVYSGKGGYNRQSGENYFIFRTAYLMLDTKVLIFIAPNALLFVFT